MARRRFQRGSLLKSGDRWIGRWREDVVDPRTGTVKRVRTSELIGTVKEFPTRRLAQRKLDDLLREINAEDYKPLAAITFQAFAERWKQAVMIHHKNSSQRAESSHINVYLVPAFGSLNLREINAEMVQSFVNQWQQSTKYLKNVVTTMMVMWDTAKAWDYVRHNPFPRGTNGKLMLRMPTIVKGETYCFTLEETLAIIDKAQGWHKTFFRILAETGVRPGELAGLRRQDVGTRSLSIRQSVWQGKVQTPKTPNALRSFAISEGLSAEIREMMNGHSKVRSSSSGDSTPMVEGLDAVALGDGLRAYSRHASAVPVADVSRVIGSGAIVNAECTLLFATETGQPLSMDNFRHRVLNPILAELGIRPDKRCGLYGLRHMNATLMDQLRVPMKTIQARLGHADGSQVTMKHYIHPVDDSGVAEQIGALLSPRAEEAVQ